MLALDAHPLRSLPSVLDLHHPLGASTGYMADQRGEWDALVDGAARVSPFAAELAALSGPELAPLCGWLAGAPPLPFHHLSLHAPTKDRCLTDAETVSLLEPIAHRLQAVVVHPDAIDDLTAWRRLGALVCVENMDGRKASGRTVAELQPIFAELPEAGFCFDVAHADAVDPGHTVARELLLAFGPRLREVHVSSLDGASHHVPLADEDVRRFEPLLRRCVDVPWILEAPLA